MKPTYLEFSALGFAVLAGGLTRFGLIILISVLLVPPAFSMGQRSLPFPNPEGAFREIEFWGPNCSDGGVKYTRGEDLNHNGKLDPNEITKIQYDCTGLYAYQTHAARPDQCPGASGTSTFVCADWGPETCAFYIDCKPPRK